eukprot:COSAG01_NODE_1495_length_10123_cov_6.359537_2_plen_200_part_00
MFVSPTSDLPPEVALPLGGVGLEVKDKSAQTPPAVTVKLRGPSTNKWKVCLRAVSADDATTLAEVVDEGLPPGPTDPLQDLDAWMGALQDAAARSVSVLQLPLSRLNPVAVIHRGWLEREAGHRSSVHTGRRWFKHYAVLWASAGDSRSRVCWLLFYDSDQLDGGGPPILALSLRPVCMPQFPLLRRWVLLWLIAAQVD